MVKSTKSCILQGGTGFAKLQGARMGRENFSQHVEWGGDEARQNYTRWARVEVGVKNPSFSLAPPYYQSILIGLEFRSFI